MKGQLAMVSRRPKVFMLNFKLNYSHCLKGSCSFEQRPFFKK